MTHDPWPTNDGIALVVLAAYAGVGYVIARAEPRNPIGWIFLALGVFTLFDYVVRLYLVLDYRDHGGRLPLGHAVAFWRGSWSIFPLILALPAIVLFPDGRLSRRWRRFMWVYAVAAVLFMTAAGRRPDRRRRLRLEPPSTFAATFPTATEGRSRVRAGSSVRSSSSPGLLRRAPGRRLAILDRRPAERS